MCLLIGVTAAFDEEEDRCYLSRLYVDAVVRAGGVPVVLPPLPFEMAATVLDQMRGLLLSGGGDLDPAYFGEEPLSGTGKVSPRRDVFELALARAALIRQVPVLGICRGMQVLNVAAGGTVYQDLVLGVKQPLKHFQEAPRWYGTHHIEIHPGTKLAGIFNVSRLRVNSFHHQAVHRVAPGFRVSAVAPDGVIEAIEAGAHPFGVGVQFHPEGMWEKESVFLGLFTALVAAAGGKRRPLEKW